MKSSICALIISLLLFGIVLATGCSGSKPALNKNPGPSDTTIVINTDVKHQTIRNFGASDAWSCQFIGLWPDNKRNKIADLLFSTALDDKGNPVGIGLSIWRFNIGAGSTAQDNIKDEWRRAESFLNNDGSYDWSRQAGQRWFMQAASQRGMDQFLGFTNSPPIYLTKNGKAFSDGGINANISPEKFTAFAKYLTNVADHLRLQEGITLNYLSPFNEPQWDWKGGQEGSPFTNQEMYDITVKLDSIISVNKLPYKILIAEAGKMNYLYEEADKPTRGNQIADFFNMNSPRYIGALPSVGKAISAHSYWTTAPPDIMVSVRQNVRNKVKGASIPIEFWQSEYCILGGQEEIRGNGKDLGMTTALYVSRLIHHDLTVANASTWQWWLAISSGNYKDGLVYVEKNKTDGTVEDSKLLWALGNYSRFIRPGSVRVDITGQNININNPTGLMASSYIDAVNKKLVTVLVNYSSSDINTKIYIKGMKVSKLIPYVTSEAADANLKPQSQISTGTNYCVPDRSVVTLVGEIK